MGRELLLEAQGRVKPKGAGTPVGGLSNPVDKSGTYGSTENKNQTTQQQGKCCLWVSRGRKQRPKNNPKLARSESTENIQGTRRKALLTLVPWNFMQCFQPRY